MSAPILPEAILKLMTPEQRAKLGKAGTMQVEADAVAAHRSEKEIQAQIEAYCDLRGFPCYRQSMHKRTSGKVGQPDFLICVPFTRGIAPHGLFVAIECKMRGNKPSPEQAAELEKIAANHGEAAVVYSAKEAIDLLKSLAFTPTDPTK